MRRGGIEPPAPRRCLMATENFTTKPSALMIMEHEFHLMLVTKRGETYGALTHFGG
ncbi:uncharacterized protein CTRU02_204138 [Colletotrichum truncatum]|uniref:Uncharacterized protein n=1 Tax=Colletotrichum truncatum TaxID=5467 RepID=A0ACC3ZB85_COLTU|nr:uncharacterized protein CTRU02_09991 [Colletotrichum truncatum]KAF6787696.1 hypothetical protein CTRU02_09991 [Colletotrichum truncatum]